MVSRPLCPATHRPLYPVSVMSIPLKWFVFRHESYLSFVTQTRVFIHFVVRNSWMSAVWFAGWKESFSRIDFCILCAYVWFCMLVSYNICKMIRFWFIILNFFIFLTTCYVITMKNKNNFHGNVSHWILHVFNYYWELKIWLWSWV